MTFADVNNYGDILLARICENEIRSRLPSAQVTLFSPTGSEVEGTTFVPFRRETVEGLDAGLLTGGQTIHSEDQLLLSIYRDQGLSTWTERPTDVSFSWLEANVAYKAWLCVGVEIPYSQEAAARVQRGLPLLDLISVRGVLSRKALDSMTEADSDAIVAPDFAWLLPNLPTRHASAQSDVPGVSKAGYVVFQTTPAIVQRTNGNISEITSGLLRVQERTGLQVLLLPINHCWHDELALRSISAASGGRLVMLPDALSSSDIASLLMGATAYIGGSLHGALTCLASGIPAGVIHPRDETKYTEAFGAQYRREFVRSDWKLEEFASDLLGEPRDSLLEVADLMRRRLAMLFDRVAVEIAQRASGARSMN
jgi:hypothetical protein